MLFSVIWLIVQFTIVVLNISMLGLSPEYVIQEVKGMAPICISNESPSDADAADLETILWESVAEWEVLPLLSPHQIFKDISIFKFKKCVPYTNK